MKISKRVLAVVLMSLLCVAFAGAAERPNVVIIYGDDVGYGDVGAYGAKMIPTPNIDKLSNQGLRFTDAHCTAATCSPSRFSMLTGILGFRNNMRVLAPNAPLKISTDAITMPKVFKKAGYQTGVIGKWHLGIGDGKTPVDWNGVVKPGPLEVGFDYSFLLPSTNDRVPCVYLENHHVVNLDPKDPLVVGGAPLPGSTIYPDGRKNPEAMTYYMNSHGHNNTVINGIGRIGTMAGGKAALWNDETMADVFIEQAKKFITNNKDNPFFLYFSSQDIHVPRTPHPRFKGKSELGYRGDAMVQLDWSTGQILDTLEKHGLTDNTIVIFSSDNGPVYDDGYQDGTTVKTSSASNDRGHYAAGPYRGGKYQIYEGGTRIPFIIRWPGKIKQGESKALFSQIDLLASFAKMLDVDLAKNEARDSRNNLDALLGKDKKGSDYIIEEAGGKALRKGSWKFVPGKAPNKKANNKKPVAPKHQLYNIDNDIAETNNVIDDHPEVAKEMEAMLKRLVANQLRE